MQELHSKIGVAKRREKAIKLATYKTGEEKNMEDPQATMNFLSGLDYRILEQLNFLSKLQEQKSPTGARYCNPSQIWLAGKLDRRRETICRRIRKLYLLGILSITHRRRRHGTWQSNLYKIVKYPQWATIRTANLLRTLGNRVRKSSHIARSQKKIISQDSKEHSKGVPEGTLVRIFEALMASKLK